MMKRILAVCLFLLVLTSLFATKITIDSYQFEIQGKTKEYAVRNLIVPKKTEVFETEEALQKAIEDKRQVLLAKRVFKTVEMEYSLTPVSTEEAKATVLVKLDSAKSLLVLPAFKYDTNTGLTLGGRLYNTNTFGMVADTALKFSAVWAADDKENVILHPIFSIEEFAVNKTLVSISADSIYYLKYQTFIPGGSISVKNIPIWKYGLNLYGSVSSTDEIHVEDVNSTYIFKADLSDMEFDEFKVKPSYELYMYDYDRTLSYQYPRIVTSGLDLGLVTLGTEDYVKIQNKNKNAFDQWDATKYYHATTLKLNNDLFKNYTYKNALTFTLDGSPIVPLLVENTLIHKLSEETTVHYYAHFNHKNGKLDYTDYGLGITQHFNIADVFDIAPTVQEHFVLDVNTLGNSMYLVVGGKANKNAISWDGNFRRGYSYSLYLDEIIDQTWSGTKSREIKDHIEFSLFNVLGKYFNPSMRAIINQQVKNPEYGFIKFNSPSSKITEYLRGIRDVTITEGPHFFDGVVNVGVLTKFPMPHLFDFVDCYVNPFLDFGVVVKDQDSEMERYVGVGMEAIGIMKDYPSYPIRVSVGIDARKFYEWVQKKGSKDFYEIFVGLGMFY